MTREAEMPSGTKKENNRLHESDSLDDMSTTPLMDEICLVYHKALGADAIFYAEYAADHLYN